jgi:general secretion pathway protein G
VGVFVKTTDNFSVDRRFYQCNLQINGIMKIQSKENKRISPRMARGFSLFEMVIVMGIIGLILGGAIYSMGKIKGSAALGAVDTDLTSFESNLEMYNRNGGTYPSTSQGLGTKYKYVYPGSKDPSRPEIISAGPDKEFGGEDDMSNQD